MGMRLFFCLTNLTYKILTIFFNSDLISKIRQQISQSLFNNYNLGTLQLCAYPNRGLCGHRTRGCGSRCCN